MMARARPVASFASHFARAGLEAKLVPPEFHAALREFGAAYDNATHSAVPAPPISMARLTRPCPSTRRALKPGRAGCCRIFATAVFSTNPPKFWGYIHRKA